MNKNWNNKAEAEMREGTRHIMEAARRKSENDPKFNNRENKCHVVNGREIWESRSIAVVGMVIFNHLGEDYVLMGKRGNALPNEVGKWCMPCGYLDYDETCEQAVRREVWEETGFNIERALNTYNQPLGKHDMDFPWTINSQFEGRSDVQNVSMHYAAYMSTNTNHLNDREELPELSRIHNGAHPGEVDEVRWIKVSELDNYEIAFNHDSNIRVYLNSNKND